MKKIYMVGFGVICLVSGLLVGYILGVYYEKRILTGVLEAIHPLRENNASYAFINPLLAYIIPSAEQQGEFQSLKNQVNSFIETERKAGRLSDAAVFFSDLDRGRWIGVNENTKYTPASMLKVVIMVAYLKAKEKDAGILEKKLVYTQELAGLLQKDPFNSQSDLVVDKAYTVEHLINRMIIDSDNGAQFLLLNHIDSNYLNTIYNALDIPNPEVSVGNFAISPREYSLFFRILYSATYLRKSNSEKALEILSKTTFNDGIVAGVSGGTMVAHKFGEHVTAENNRIKYVELHDCGIVYYASNPYFLCVMTRGTRIDELKNVIKNISSLVYQGRL